MDKGWAERLVPPMKCGTLSHNCHRGLNQGLTREEKKIREALCISPPIKILQIKYLDLEWY